MKAVYFEERQQFPLWLWVLAGCVFLGITGYLIYVYFEAARVFRGYVVLAWSSILAMDLLIANMFYMVTRVMDKAVYVTFGRYFPMIRSKIPFADIRNLRVIEYNPLWDAGGWGYRYGRLKGEPARFMNARGARGVYLEAKGHRYVIGSQEPERLLEAIARKIETG